MNIIKAVVLAIVSLIGILAAMVGGLLLKAKVASSRNLRRLEKETPDLMIDGLPFRDLNRNGRLDIYEDFRRPIDERVEDLLGQMTLEEKVGLMMHPMINPGKQGDLAEMPSFMSPLSTSEMVINRHIKHFNIVFAKDAQAVASWYNKLQAMAERTRLGIPVTISSDPRHGSENNPGAGMRMPGFSQWPDPLGLAATRDVDLVERFGDIARQEYRAVGIRSALHPMADLATEPRWARIVRHLRRRRRTRRQDDDRLHPWLPGRGSRSRECRLHGQAFSRWRSSEGWPRSPFRLRQGAGLPRR